MSREPIEMYSHESFDHESHIAEFLHTSAVYLGVNADHLMASSHRPWQPIPAIPAREARYA